MASDDYELLHTIGRGGQGEVKLAFDHRLQRKVAVKFIRTDSREHQSQEVLNEARLLGRLNHPNVIQVYDLMLENDELGIVMEYIEGSSLHLRLREQLVPLELRIKWLSEAALGIAAAHAKEIAHQDLKAENILINNQGIAKVGDFGIGGLSTEQGDRLFYRDLVALGELIETVLGNDLGQLDSIYLLCQKLTNPTSLQITAREVSDTLRIVWQQLSTIETVIPEQDKRAPKIHRVAPIVIGTIACVVILLVARELSEPDNTYIALMPASIEFNETINEIQAEALGLTFRQALSDNVIASKQLSLIALDEVDDVIDDSYTQPGFRTVSRAVGADETIRTHLSCSNQICRARIERVAVADAEVIAVDSTVLPIDEPHQVYALLRQRWSRLYADSDLASDGYEIEEDQFLTFMRLQQRSNQDNASHREILNDLRELSTTKDDFIPLTELLVHASLEVYDETSDPEVLSNAVTLVEKATLRFPDSAVLQMSLFELNRLSGNYLSATDNLESLVALGIPESERQTLSGKLSADQGRYDAAEAHYLAALNLHKSRALYYDLIATYYRGGKWDEARKLIHESLTFFPDDANAIHTLGMIELETGQVDIATGLFKRATTLSPHALYEINLSLANILGRNYPEAHETLTSLESAGIESTLLLLNLADTKQLMGLKLEASEYYNRIIQMSENSQPVPRAAVAQALAQTGRHIEAITLINQQKSTGADIADTTFSAALVYALASQQLASVAEVEKSISLGMSPVWFRLPWFDPLCHAETRTIFVRLTEPQRCSDQSQK